MFVAHKHGVYDSWVECQKNVLFYKGGVYKAYTSKEEVVRAWVFNEPRWKRSDGCSSTAKPRSKHGVDDHHSLQNISCTYVINFFVSFFVACIFLIEISTLT